MGIEDIFNMPQEEVAEAPQEVVEEVTQEIAEPVVEEPQPEPEAPVEREEKSVPLPTFLDMRDKQKEAERRAADLERQLAEARAAQQTQPQAPDPFDDPQGFAAFNQQQLAAALYEQKLQFSFGSSVEKHGEEATEAARLWAIDKAQNDPAFDAMLATEMKRQISPFDWIVRQHKRDSLLSQVGEDPDEFVRRRAAELGLIAPAAPAVEPQQVATPARSLAAAPSKAGAVKDIPVGPMTALSTLFK